MGFDDAFGDRQPESDPGLIVARSDPVEPLEQARLLLRRDAWAAIFNGDPHVTAGSLGPYPDQFTVRAVLRGVSQQVREHLSHVRSIGQYVEEAGCPVAFDALL